LKFNQKVYDIYMKLGALLPNLMGDENIFYINGEKSKEDVWEEVIKVYDLNFRI